MVKINKIRGKTVGFYLAIVAFGVGSSFYIYRPILQALEERRRQSEIGLAVQNIQAVQSTPKDNNK